MTATHFHKPYEECYPDCPPKLPEGIHPIPRVEMEYFKGDIMDRRKKVYTLRGTEELIEIIKSREVMAVLEMFEIYGGAPEDLAYAILDQVHDWDWDDDYEEELDSK